MAFVFGAAVTNNRQQRRRRVKNNSSILSTNSTATQDGQSSEASVVGALHDEEARLLAQLAATRNKLKAVSKSKVSSRHQRASPPETSSAYHQPPRQQQQQQHRRSQSVPPPERLSLPSVSTRVVPILSSTGEPVFEVGLNGSSTAEHILPVFRLPQVDDSAEFVNRIPTELTENEAEREAENREDDAALAASLGLSVEELVEFQMEAAERTGNKQQLRRAWESQRSLLSRDGGSRLLDGPESQLRPEGLPALRLESHNNDDGQQSSTASQSMSLKRPRPSGSDAYGSRKTPRCLQHGSNPSREQLRGELKKSINMIHYLTEQVREDIARVNETVPIQSVKAQLFMQRWGLEKFQKIFFRIQMSFIIAAFRKWKHMIENDKHEEKRQNYMKLKASKNLKHLGNRLRNKDLHHAFELWWSGVEKQRIAEEFERHDHACRIIQRAARAYIARIVIRDLKSRLKRELKSRSAIIIQALFRGVSTRKQVSELLDQIEMNRAVLCVQRAWRGRMGRIMYRESKKKARELWATKLVQNSWRGRHARALMATMREQRKRNHAAIILQSHFRRLLSRNLLKDKRSGAREHKMASRIQARIRGKFARRGVSHLVEARDKRKKLEYQAATTIQKMFRARKAYITYMLKLQAYRASMAKGNAAAMRVQAIYRGRLARRLVRDMSGENHDEMVERAREYTEIWDEDSQGYFYYNNYTEAALWEPPASGFTKADGKLVLRNGDVIPDPSIDPASNAKKCIECTTEYASRYCTDCDDHYCDDCWTKTHSAGKRALHSFELTGPTKCVECSVDVAVMWCDDCDDPYCKDCYASVHKAGKRKKHKWTTIGADPVVLDEDTTTAAGGYDDGSGGGSGVDAFMQAEAGGEWSEYYDDESGSPYWYNETTGESSYVNPYDAAAADAAIAGDAYGADAYGSESYGGADAAAGWTEQYDDDGNTYWWNEATGESSYQDPNGGGAAAAYDDQEGYGGYDDSGGYAEGYDESYGY
jgi:hypothetical protein